MADSAAAGTVGTAAAATPAEGAVPNGPGVGIGTGFSPVAEYSPVGPTVGFSPHVNVDPKDPLSFGIPATPNAAPLPPGMAPPPGASPLPGEEEEEVDTAGLLAGVNPNLGFDPNTNPEAGQSTTGQEGQEGQDAGPGEGEGGEGDGGDGSGGGGDGGDWRGGSIGHHHMRDDDESWDSADTALRLAGHRRGYADAGAVETIHPFHDPQLDVPDHPWPTLPPLPYRGPELRNLASRPTPELQERIAEDVAPFVPVPGIGVAGKALRAAAPMSIPALAGVAGLSFTGSNAEGENAKSPAQQQLEALLEQQRALTKQRVDAAANRDLQMKGDPARNIRPGTGPSYRASEDELKRIDAQLNAITAQGGPLEKAQAAVNNEHTDQLRQTSNTEIENAEKNMSGWDKVLRDYGPSAGYVLGAVLGPLFGHGVGKGMGAYNNYVTNRANKLVGSLPAKVTATNVKDVYTPVNQFWSEGGSKAEPFLDAPGRKPPLISNPSQADVAKASELYPPPGKGQKTLEVGANLLGAGGFGYESHVAGDKLDQARQELTSARAAMEAQPSAVNAKRVQDAEASVGLWEGAQTLGRIGAGGQMVGGLGTMALRGTPRPDIAKGQAGRFSVEDYLNRSQPKPPPVPPAALVPEGGGGGPPRLPPALPNVKALPPPAGGGQAPPPSTDLSLTNPPVPSGKRGLGGSKSKGNKPETEEDAKQIFNPDDPTKLTKGMRRGGIVGRALGIARKFADGGAVHAGPIQQAADGGRTDTVPLDVASGAYVIPADVVSHLGQGDTNAGYRVLTHMYGPQTPRPGPDGKTVPIMAAGGEFVISPDGVAKVGRGDVAAGHDALDQWVKMERRKNIMALRKLPGPAKN